MSDTPFSHQEDGIIFDNIEMPLSMQSSQVIDRRQSSSKNSTPAAISRSGSIVAGLTPSSAFVRDQLNSFQNKHGRKLNKMIQLNDMSKTFGSNTFFNNSNGFATSTRDQQTNPPEFQPYSTTTTNNNNKINVINGFTSTGFSQMMQNNQSRTFMTSLDNQQKSTKSQSWSTRTQRPYSKVTLQAHPSATKRKEELQENIHAEIFKIKESQMQSVNNNESFVSNTDSLTKSFLNTEQQQKFFRLRTQFEINKVREEKLQHLLEQQQEERHLQRCGTFSGALQEAQERIQAQNNLISDSAALNRGIQKIRSSKQTEGIFEKVKINRMQNGMEYKKLVGSMSKQIKPVSKELEELKCKLNGKHIEQIEKILQKLSIINFDRNQKMKDNANTQIIFDKMMAERCDHRHRIEKHSKAKLSVRLQLDQRDKKIDFLNVPKYDNSWKKQDFFPITHQSIKEYQRVTNDDQPNQECELNEILQLYAKGQEDLMARLRDFSSENTYDARKFSEREVDPFFNDPFLKELMCKHLIFRKGNQKSDFFGTIEPKKRNIEEILQKLNNPSECSSDFDSEQSFFYLPMAQTMKQQSSRQNE